MCVPNGFILFESFFLMFWFVRGNIIPGNLGFARYEQVHQCFSVCRLRDMGVYLRVCMCVCLRIFNY